MYVDSPGGDMDVLFFKVACIRTSLNADAILSLNFKVVGSQKEIQKIFNVFNRSCARMKMNNQDISRSITTDTDRY